MSDDQPRIEYFLYARKSSESEDRQVQSIDDQLDRLKDFALSKGLIIKKIYTEAKSAKKPNNRPLFDEMIARIEKGEAQGILCWQINRVSRNPIDSGRIQWLLQKGILKSIQTIDKEYRPEDNVLLFSVESGVANQFILDLSKNVKRGIESKLLKGNAPFLAPLGYLNDKTKDRGERDIIPDPDRFNVVRKMWDLMLTGNYTPPKILAIANNQWGFRTRKLKRIGDVPLSNSGIYKLFKSPFYAGIIEWSGRQYEGKHKAMITMEEYEHVQRLLGKAGRPCPQKHYFPFTGMILCGECGCSITAESKTKLLSSGKYGTYTYYHCSKRKKYIKCTQGRMVKDTELADQIEQKLEALTIAPEFLDMALEDINDPKNLEKGMSNDIVEMQQRTLLDSENQLKNLTGLRVRDLIGDEEFLRDRKDLQDKIFQLKEQMKQNVNKAEQFLELERRTFNFATYARIHFKNGAPEEQKEILGALGSNHSIIDKNLGISVYKWLLPIINEHSRIEADYRRLEPTNSLANKSKNRPFEAVRTQWLGVIQDVRTYWQGTKERFYIPNFVND